MYKVLYNLIFFPTAILFNHDFLPQNFRPLSFPPLDILPKSLKIVGKMILLPI